MMAAGRQEATVDGSARNPREMVQRYFDALRRGDFDAAAASFSADVFYSHPPYAHEPPGSPRHEVRGREALLDLFTHGRGKKQPQTTELDLCAMSGDRGFVSGRSILADGSTKSFVAEIAVGRDGLLTYFAVYSSAPGSVRRPRRDKDGGPVDKLIITCATAWDGYEGVEGLHAPRTALETAESVREARDAGAAVTHVHAPFQSGREGPAAFHVDGWRELAELVRGRTDIVFEHGQGGLPFIVWDHSTQKHPTEEERKAYTRALGEERPEMISVLLNEIDWIWPRLEFYVMPTRPELEKYLRMCNEHSVKPAFEIWHSGSFWNLAWLEQRGVVSAPYWLTLFFGANGGMSGPATIDELMNRVRAVPVNALWQVAVFCGTKGYATTEDQIALVTHAIAMGGHVRVGMEDNPYIRDGVPAKSNAELVERVVRIAREVGREIATPDEARAALGLAARR